MQSRRWTFTVNNFTAEEEQAIKEAPECFTYVVFGREHLEEGTPHLQGYFELERKKTIGGIKRACRGLQRAHLEVARGTAEENKTYCSKEDQEFFERGEPIPDPGESGRTKERERWATARALAESGDFDEIDPQIFISNYNTLQRINRDAEWRRVRAGLGAPSIGPLRPWEQELERLLQMEPHDRQIHIVVDPVGGAGKSTFARYLRHTQRDVQILLPGRGQDLAFALKPARVYIFDCPRSSSQFLQWSFIEAVKNGYVFSPKYESGFLEFKIPHVLVFMNEEVPEGALSQDRINLISV